MVSHHERIVHADAGLASCSENHGLLRGSLRVFSGRFDPTHTFVLGRLCRSLRKER